MKLDLPPIRDPMSPLAPSWVRWFVDAQAVITRGPAIGKKRPDKPGEGYMFVDQNLGKPIWFLKGKWVDATGGEV